MSSRGLLHGAISPWPITVRIIKIRTGRKEITQSFCRKPQCRGPPSINLNQKISD